MFGLFNKGEWEPSVLTEMNGSYNGLHVTLRNFSCLLDKKSGRKKFASPDFGEEFRFELIDKQFNDHQSLQSTLSTGASSTVYVDIDNLSTIEVSISGNVDDDKEEFFSNLLDAIIDAYEKNGLTP